MHVTPNLTPIKIKIKIRISIVQTYMLKIKCALHQDYYAHQITHLASLYYFTFYDNYDGLLWRLRHRSPSPNPNPNSNIKKCVSG